MVAGVICLAIGTSIITTNVNRNLNGVQASQTTQSVRDRVVKSGVLKVGYIVYPPFVAKDPNSGQLSGTDYEIINQMAQNLGVKVQWTEEVGYASMIEGLQANRYDIVPGIWQNSARSKLVDFSDPLYYTAFDVYVRTGDARFTDNLDAINQPGVKIAAIDGQSEDAIAKSQFPKASEVSHPDISDPSVILEDVASKKADLTFAEPVAAAAYIKNNPGVLQNVSVGKPLRTYGYTMIFKQDQPDFKLMLDTAISEVLNSGFVDGVLDKSDPSLYRVAKPFRIP